MLKSSQLAIAGSRNPTSIGAEIAADFAKALVVTGFVITSGLAIGIDAASHIAAIKLLVKPLL
ncbi:MAG: DNA-protecting protein DprA [Coxiellaceae bacterium]|nr:DNA-protecting protein DprA [Coxiellaceae bacterium]